MFGGLFAWPVSELLGRQTALMLGGVPFLTGWVFIANAVQITHSRVGFLGMLFTGRMLTGFGTGWSIFSASVSTYIHGCMSIGAVRLLYCCPNETGGGGGE